MRVERASLFIRNSSFIKITENKKIYRKMLHAVESYDIFILSAYTEEYPSPAEGSGLENRQGLHGPRGFESLLLRHIHISNNHGYRDVAILCLLLDNLAEISNPNIKKCVGSMRVYASKRMAF